MAGQIGRRREQTIRPEDKANFAALIQFLESQGNVQVLSSPRIATLNDQMRRRMMWIALVLLVTLPLALASPVAA